jgi:curved DNA-binding protein CbpA
MPQYLIDPTKDLYAILKLKKSAGEEQIKKSYKRLALKFHPDRKTGDNDKMASINKAYEILGDNEKRKYYDRIREEYLSSQGSWDYSSNSSESPESHSFWDNLQHRHLRDFIIDSMHYFQRHFGMRIPEEVLDDFQEAVEFVYCIWEELNEEDEIKYVTFGGFRVPRERLEDVSRHDSLND